MIDDVLAEVKDRMDKTIDSFRHDLQSIRTGRANPALLDKISVDYQGTPTPLKQIANISVPEAQQLLIRPYSSSDIKAIETAISKSDLGLTPNNDGAQIRLNLPPLTEERRRDLTKMVSKRSEEAKVSIRNIRRDGMKDLKDFEEEKLISEDDLTHGEKMIQEKTDGHIKLIEDITKDKDAEIMKVQFFNKRT